jgi:hypothetical protein
VFMTSSIRKIKLKTSATCTWCSGRIGHKM